MPGQIQFKLLPYYQKIKRLHNNGNSFLIFPHGTEIVHRSQSEKEETVQIEYPFLFSQLGIALGNGMYLYKQYTFTFRK